MFNRFSYLCTRIFFKFYKMKIVQASVITHYYVPEKYQIQSKTNQNHAKSLTFKIFPIFLHLNIHGQSKPRITRPRIMRTLCIQYFSFFPDHPNSCYISSTGDLYSIGSEWSMGKDVCGRIRCVGDQDSELYLSYER